MRVPKASLPIGSIIVAACVLLSLFVLERGGLYLPMGMASTGVPADKPAPKTSPAVRLKLEREKLPQGILYTLTIPANSGYKIMPVLSDKLAGVDSPVWQGKGPQGKKPVFVINGGYFDPQNSLTTSYVFERGLLTGDPRVNPHLVGNPDLRSYLPKIFNRSEFRVYLCRDGADYHSRYDIVPHDTPMPEDCLLQDAVGAGPMLLPTLTDYLEGFVDYNAQGKRTRDPIGVAAHNARSALGLTGKGDVVIVMGAQIPGKSASGFSLAEMAAALKARGALKAISLDGGSSSGLWFEGKPVYGKFNKDGAPVKRPVKSVVMVVPGS